MNEEEDFQDYGKTFFAVGASNYEWANSYIPMSFQDYGEPFVGQLDITVQAEGDNFDLVVILSVMITLITIIINFISTAVSKLITSVEKLPLSDFPSPSV